MDKLVPSFQQAVLDVFDGAVIFIGGFGGPGGMPHFLINALYELGSSNLTLISNTAGISMAAGFGAIEGKRLIDHSILIEKGMVKKCIASFPVAGNPRRVTAFERAYRQKTIDLEMVPQGTLAERIRAAGAGIPAFYTPTGVGTFIENDKEVRQFGEREYLLEQALHADFAFVRAWQGDRNGNLIYRGSSQNFNALMATAANVTIAEVDNVVGLGDLPSEAIHTQSLFVDRIVERPKDESKVSIDAYVKTTE
ncbi:3-oxoacid CoA-transferase subunit A [SAR202 cluster bacterium AD-802-E10_MRT_200m]|nr:3-oxoacid CoA-transferase subunit A [SAR202 cluster bacterium AD-802-E10_MRT_200m]MQF82857.1 3-oxoacid CoA-transferase subunit A [SAR202 cluster bacterium AD-802-E10_MRT_200m]